MSKASRYAEAHKALYPSPLCDSSGEIQIATVTESGRLHLLAGFTISSETALKLRDWLTETFDDPVQKS